MKRIFTLVALVASLAVVPTASAALTTIPHSDPTIAAPALSPVATTFVNLDAAPQTVDFSTPGTITVSDGSSCVALAVKRGANRTRCTLPVGGEALLQTLTWSSGGHTYTTAYTKYNNGASVLGSVDYLQDSAPFVPGVSVLTCAYTKTWGYRPPFALSICPDGTKYPDGTVRFP